MLCILTITLTEEDPINVFHNLHVSQSLKRWMNRWSFFYFYNNASYSFCFLVKLDSHFKEPFLMFGIRYNFVLQAASVHSASKGILLFLSHIFVNDVNLPRILVYSIWGSLRSVYMVKHHFCRLERILS